MVDRGGVRRIALRHDIAMSRAMLRVLDCRPRRRNARRPGVRQRGAVDPCEGLSEAFGNRGCAPLFER